MRSKRIIFTQFQTLLDRDVQFDGVVESKEDVIIAGKVKGEIHSSHTIHILQDAHISGDIKAKSCASYGATVDGDLRVAERLKVYSGSRISCSIQTQELDIEAGATVNGTITMKEGSESSQKKAETSKEQA